MNTTGNDPEAPIQVERIASDIVLLRGKRIMMDEDLAGIYGVKTKRLNEQVRRNKNRFPEDFRFTLTSDEFSDLRSQSATSRWGGRRSPPSAFTEHGAVMLAAVLKSPTAVTANIQVVRAFVRLRTMLTTNQELAQKLAVLGKNYDQRFQIVFTAIRRLMRPAAGKKPRIGFK